VRRDDVDTVEEGREGGLVGGERAEEEDEQDETVFAAVVGEGDFFQTG
jgi:hypothetical protein